MIPILVAQAGDAVATGGTAGLALGAIYFSAKALEWFHPAIRARSQNGKCNYSESDRKTVEANNRLVDQNNRALDRILGVCSERDEDRIPLCYVPRRWESILEDIRDELRKLNRNGAK